MVELKLTNGPDFNLPYKTGMNIQTALEAAFNSVPPASFSYALQYYGTSLGYLVSMINETYESFNSKEAPFFFWEILVNGNVSPTGIDNTPLKDGDSVVFDFIPYIASTPAKSTLHAKFRSKRTSGS
jgi:molybdopterin converting factor small subunit